MLLPLGGGSWGIGRALRDWQPRWCVCTPLPDEPAAALSCLQQLHDEGWVGGGGQHPRGKLGTGIKKRVSILGKVRLGRAKNVNREAARDHLGWQSGDAPASLSLVKIQPRFGTWP